MAKSDVKEELAKRAGAIRGSAPDKQISNADSINSGGGISGTNAIGTGNGLSSIHTVDNGSEISDSYAVDSEKESDFIRLLRADEIECRVSTINEKGLVLLLFKDARVDQRILDETFTPFGWKRNHQCIEGNLYCTVEIWDAEKGQWIAKQDVGTTSYSEKEKGQASDSFKRACFNWGIGRELYTAPFIWIPAGKASIQKKGDRYVTSDRFSVQSIGYNLHREISALVIINQNGCSVFELKQKPEQRADSKSGQNRTQRAAQKPEQKRELKSGHNRTQGAEQETEPKSGQNRTQKSEQNRVQNTRQSAAQKTTDVQAALLEKELERTGVSIETVLSRYHITSVEQMTADIYTRALNGLKHTKTKDAA